MYKCAYRPVCKSYEHESLRCCFYSKFCSIRKEFEREEERRLAERKQTARKEDLGLEAWMRSMKE